MSLRLLVISLALFVVAPWAAGCNDTAIVLRVASNRPAAPAPPALDAICVELDAGGGERFGRRYDLPSLPLPQTLTVLPGGKPSTQAIVFGLHRGIEVARSRRQLSFRSGSVLHVDVPLDACAPHAIGAAFEAAAAASGDAVDAALLAPGPQSPTAGDVALAMASGRSARYSVAAAGAGALVGGAPDPTGGRVRQIVSADLDRDCRLDAVVVSEGAPLTAWHDGGDGSFSALGAIGAADVIAAAAGDVDGDGLVDLVAVGGSAAHVWLGDGTGHFRERPGSFDAAPTDATAVALADLDGDGRIDVVLGQGRAMADVPRVYLNDKNGPGHFIFTAAALPPKPGRVAAVVVADADGDGDLDVAMALYGGAVRLYINRGDAYLDDRSFTLLPDQVSADVPSLLYTDLDGDCLPDLVVPRAGAAPLLWLSAGAGKLVSGPAFGQAMVATGALSDDVDGNGLPDVLLYGGMTGLQLELHK